MHSEPPIKRRTFSSAKLLPRLASANKSNGYEDVASVFITGRGRNSFRCRGISCGWFGPRRCLVVEQF